jgi:hypothetical protein
LQHPGSVSSPGKNSQTDGTAAQAIHLMKGSASSVDFSRNVTSKDDTYVKLLNVNTFESEDYGIGLR